MKKKKLLVFIILFCIVSISMWNYVSACNRIAESQIIGTHDSNSPEDIPFRNVSAVDFSRLDFNPWNVDEASKFVEKRDKKPYTIMVYMNGSDLESQSGAATEDLIEILESGVDSNNVNLVIFTGGTNRWQNNVVPENECVLWEIEDGMLYDIAGVGLVNMGNPGTLSSFINFSVYNFPADKYGLIMWDHGGGSIVGFGHDEKFVKNNLSLLDMNYAFDRSVLAQNKLEFLGFDSCLMATLEMGEVASNYAKYLIASEDLEPGAGWDYYFLSTLNDNPQMDGAELGKNIIDYFIAYYGKDSDQILTLSVVNLSNIRRVSRALDNLMARCSHILLTDRKSSFNLLAGKRNMTKTFGEGSPRDNQCDMVDIGDMAGKLSDLYSNEARILIEKLNECVLYNRNNSDVNLNGLSVYYIYGGKEYGNYSLNTYESLKVNERHTEYLNKFYSMLTSNYPSKRSRGLTSGENTIQAEVVENRLTVWQPASDSPGKYVMKGINYNKAAESSIKENLLWPTIHGERVCLYKINSTESKDFYAIPVVLNGNECDIIAAISEEYPDGRLLGVRKEDGIIIQKGFDPIAVGDKLAFYYEERSLKDDVTDNENWHMGDEFTVAEELKLEWQKLNDDEEYFYSNLIGDTKGNKFFDELKPAATTIYK
ncbi:MAG: clostripain-related cysteine peptidase [Oscillospiraceae bacterium]|nr:clostripain-related cysteine peptidase [Oscillospiraceae bacterium]